jgi:hypothetical protein
MPSLYLLVIAFMVKFCLQIAVRRHSCVAIIGARAAHSTSLAKSIPAALAAWEKFASPRDGTYSRIQTAASLTRLREKLSLRADDKIHLFGAVTAAVVAERNLSFTLAKYLGVLLNFKQLGQSFAKVATEKWAGGAECGGVLGSTFLYQMPARMQFAAGCACHFR